jgi:hypothetical protein
MPVSPDYSAFVNNQTIDPSDVSTPITQVANFANGLETSLNSEISTRASADTNIVNGATALERLTFGTPQSVTINAGTFAASAKTRYIVDTQGAAATDDLDAITGLAVGQIVILQIANNARVVVIKHNLANGFFNLTGGDITLTDTNRTFMGMWNGSRCVQIGNPNLTLQLREFVDVAPVAVSALTVPDNAVVTTGYGAPWLAMVPGMAARNRFAIRASAAAVVSDMIATPATIGTAVFTEANQEDSTYINMATIATAGTVSGWATTFNLVQRRHSPTLNILVRTPADITSLRYWIGFFSAAITNVDDAAAGTQVMGFRFSTIAGDAGWRAICDDGTTATIGADTMPILTADTPYMLRIRVDGSGGGTVYFSVNNNTEMAINTNVPVAGQNLGLACYLVNQVAAARSLRFGRAECEFN